MEFRQVSRLRVVIKHSLMALTCSRRNKCQTAGARSETDYVDHCYGGITDYCLIAEMYYS